MSAVESWFAPAAVAEPLPAKRSPRRTSAASSAPRRAAGRAKPKARGRSFRVRLPLVWMVVFAVLLVGVVAVNVAVLRANVSVNNLNAQITQRQQEIATLKSQWARDTAAQRIENVAHHDGLSPATSSQTTVVDLGRRK